MQSMEDVRQVLSQAFTAFQNQLLAQLPITDMGGERLSNVAFPVDADDAVTLRYLDSMNGVANGSSNTSVSVQTAGNTELTDITVSTATYSIPPTGVDIVTLNPGVVQVNLPDLTVVRTKPLWLINSSGGNVAVVASGTQTVENNHSITIYPNARLQFIPNV